MDVRRPFKRSKRHWLLSFIRLNFVICDDDGHCGLHGGRRARRVSVCALARHPGTRREGCRCARRGHSARAADTACHRGDPDGGLKRGDRADVICRPHGAASRAPARLSAHSSQMFVAALTGGPYLMWLLRR
jgi:hypothetical protein